MKVFTQFISSLIGGIALGIIGLIIGAIIGGNFGFPEFGGNAGYEAGGVFFAIVGISFGSLLGIVTAKNRQKEQHKDTVGVLVAILMTVVGVALFDYNLPLVNGLIILLLPPVAMTVVMNWRAFSKAKQV